jgi:hypothetical protein
LLQGIGHIRIEHMRITRRRLEIGVVQQALH